MPKVRKKVKRKINEREIRLKTLLLCMGVKITEIAKKTKLSQPMVTYYIQGNRNSKRLDKYFEKLQNEYVASEGRFKMQVKRDL